MEAAAGPRDEKPIEDSEKPPKSTDLEAPPSESEPVPEAPVDAPGEAPVETAEVVPSDKTVSEEGPKPSTEIEDTEGGESPAQEDVAAGNEQPTDDGTLEQPIDLPREGEVAVAEDVSPVEATTPAPDMSPDSSAMPQQQIIDAAGGDDSDDRRVSFAPGTPDPPSRKKKSSKGSKVKKKKNVALPGDLPPEVLAMLEGDLASFGLPPPPPPPPADLSLPSEDPLGLGQSVEVPVESSEPVDPVSLNEDTSDVRQESLVEPPQESKDNMAVPDTVVEELAEKERTHSAVGAENASDDTAAAAPEGAEPDSAPIQEPPTIPDPAREDAPHDDPPVETVEALPPLAETITPEPKKKSSKKKKKSPNKKSEGAFPAGLGIDLPPPIPDLDDILKDLGPPGSWETPKDMPAFDFSPPPPPGEIESAPAGDLIPEPAVTGDDSAAGASPADDVADRDIGKADDAPLDNQEPAASTETEPSPGATGESGSDEAPADDKSELGVGKEDTNEDATGGSLEEVGSPVDSGVELDGASDGADEGGKPENKDSPESVTQLVPDKEEASNGDGLSDAASSIEEDSGSEATSVEDFSAEVLAAEPEVIDVLVEPKEGNGNEPADQASGNSDSAEKVSGETDGPPETVSDGAHGPDDVAAPTADGEQPKEDDGLKEDATPTEKGLAEPQVLATEQAVATGEQASKDEDVAPEVAVEPSDPPAAEEPAVTEEEVKDAAQEDDAAEPAPEAPPSPNLSKTSSHGSSKRTHWERPHTESKLNGVFQNSKVLEKPRGSKRSSGGSKKDEVRIRDRRPRDRDRKESPEEAEARRQRRRERKAKEAAEAEEAERKRMEEERERRIRHEEKKAARLEEKARLIREQAKAAAESRKDEEPDRRRRRGSWRSSDRPGSSRSDAKLVLPTMTVPTWSKFGLGGGESTHGRGQVATASSPSSSRRSNREVDTDVRPSSSSGSKSHRRRHHHSRSEEQRSTRSGEHRSRRSTGEEQRSGGGFLSSLFRRS